MTRLGAFAVVLALSGCAESYLTSQIRGVDEDFPSMSRPVGAALRMQDVKAYAWAMAEAYAQAARNTALAQYITAGVLIAAAASTVIGGINEVADDVLAKRAAVAATAQQVGQRGVPMASIKALYDGARRINCIATVGAAAGWTRAPAAASGSPSPADFRER